MCVRGKRLTGFALRKNVRHARGTAIEAAGIAGRMRGPAGYIDWHSIVPIGELRAETGSDTEKLRGMAAVKAHLGYSPEGMTAHYVGHRKGKLVKPTK